MSWARLKVGNTVHKLTSQDAVQYRDVRIKNAAGSGTNLYLCISRPSHKLSQELIFFLSLCLALFLRSFPLECTLLYETPRRILNIVKNSSISKYLLLYIAAYRIYMIFNKLCRAFASRPAQNSTCFLCFILLKLSHNFRATYLAVYSLFRIWLTIFYIKFRFLLYSYIFFVRPAHDVIEKKMMRFLWCYPLVTHQAAGRRNKKIW